MDPPPPAPFDRAATPPRERGSVVVLTPHNMSPKTPNASAFPEDDSLDDDTTTAPAPEDDDDEDENEDEETPPRVPVPPPGARPPSAEGRPKPRGFGTIVMEATGGEPKPRLSMAGGERASNHRARDSLHFSTSGRRVGSVAVPAFEEEEDKGPVLGGHRTSAAMKSLSKGQAGSTRASSREAPRDRDDDASSSSSSSSDDDDDARKDAEEKVVLGEGDREALLLASLVSDAARDSGVGDGRLRVADTVLFRSGVPVCWLFTDSRGRVRRRHAKRLTWNEIRYNVQFRGRANREGGPDAPVAVLRWRTTKPPVDLPDLGGLTKVPGHAHRHHKRAQHVDNAPLAVTLLDWRDLKALDSQIPASAGPNLKSWTQFVALQPLVVSHVGAHACVFLHGHAVHFDRRVEAPSLPSRPGLPAADEARELMNWPGPAPRRGRPPEPSGSARAEDATVAPALSEMCGLVSDRAETSHGSACGGTLVLSKALGLRSFIAEFVFDKRRRPVLLFVRHVVLRPVGNHHRRVNAWRNIRGFVLNSAKKKKKPVAERFSEFVRVRKQQDAPEGDGVGSDDLERPSYAARAAAGPDADDVRLPEKPRSPSEGTVRAHGAICRTSSLTKGASRRTLADRATVRKRVSVMQRAVISKYDRERRSKIDAEHRRSRKFRMRHATLNTIMTDPF